MKYQGYFESENFNFNIKHKKELKKISENQKRINVKDWILLSTTMIGIVLTILALIWQSVPSSGSVVTSFLLMIDFILFVNSVSANSKANFEIKNSLVDMDRVNRFVHFAEYSFGIGFTMVIVAFSILGYKYLVDFVGKSLLTLALPLTFLLIDWILIVIYNSINYAGKGFKVLRSLKRNIWIFLELICLSFILLDYFGILVIPQM